MKRLFLYTKLYNYDQGRFAPHSYIAPNYSAGHNQSSIRISALA